MLFRSDETYSKLYSEKYSLEVYYKVGKIGKMIQNYLRKLPNWTTAEKSDILFYLLYALCAKILNKTSYKLHHQLIMMKESTGQRNLLTILAVFPVSELTIIHLALTSIAIAQVAWETASILLFMVNSVVLNCFS